MALFEFALSGFWTFLGTVILIGVIGTLVISFVVGTIGAVRGANVNINGSLISLGRRDDSDRAALRNTQGD